MTRYPFRLASTLEILQTTVLNFPSAVHISFTRKEPKPRLGCLETLHTVLVIPLPDQWHLGILMPSVPV